MAEFLIRLAHSHQSFRRPELEAIADLLRIKIEFLSYSLDSPYCIVRLESVDAARNLVARSILADSVLELWGQGKDYPELHTDVKARTGSRWNDYKKVSFRFNLLSFQGKRDTQKQREIIESFGYLAFEGPIRMKNAEEEFSVLEQYDKINAAEPDMLYFGRVLGNSCRNNVLKYDLKKRKYISTTSMDAELALVTANIAQASPGKIFFDPFMGTGGFPIAASHFGAISFGSDIDGRSIRGKAGRSVVSNFVQYDLTSHYLGAVVSDLTNTPLRKGRWLDGIICDPPYGVREGLKVLGSRTDNTTVKYAENGQPMYSLPEYIAPKKPYSFDAMLDDILYFAAEMLVDGGRLSMWMPTANDEDIELTIPRNEYLDITSCCVQSFNKWSRRLLTYTRLPESSTGPVKPRAKKSYAEGVRADELNHFRKKYFDGFRDTEGSNPQSQIPT